MRRCAAKPYEGQEKYIFVSYCHRDRAYVFPVIEQLTKDGYRVWYDEGIDPGSEWPEIIAKHLNGSAICIAFITANSLNSHNCRREINFALLKKKCFISVVLEPVQMSLGMEMQLSSSQSIFKYTLPTEKEFFSKLYEAKVMESCKGSPNYSIEVSIPSDFLSDSDNFDKVRDPFSDRWFAQGDGETQTDSEEAACQAAEEEERRKAEEAARKAAEEEERRKAEEAARKATEEERRKAEEAARKAAEEAARKAEEAARKAAEEARRKVEEAAHKAEEAVRKVTEEAKQQVVASIHVLKREKTGEIISINKTPFKIGRSSTADDYIITDNRAISRSHATLVVKNNVCYITDNGSLNKTFINGTVITPGKECALSSGDNVKLYNERFVYLKYHT